MIYTYKFTKAKRLSKGVTQMAYVTVYDVTGNEVGKYSWSLLPKNEKIREQIIKDAVAQIAKEYAINLSS